MSGVTRPHSINYPSVYYTFEAQDLHTNSLIEYRVEDFPRHRFEEGIQFMVQNFFEHEVVSFMILQFFVKIIVDVVDGKDEANQKRSNGGSGNFNFLA